MQTHTPMQTAAATAGKSAAPSAADNAADASPAYLQYLGRLRGAWSDIPQLRVAFKQLSVTFARPLAKKGDDANHKHVEGQKDGDGEKNAPDASRYTIPTLANQSAFWAGLPFQLAARRLGLTAEPRLYALQDVSGVIEPGSMTLILAPPGHGKSSLLKALCGRLPPSSLRGSLLYNGRTAAELAADGVHLKRLTAYVGQMDLHFPALTVRETVTFAAQSSVADASLLPAADAELIKLEQRRADMLIDMLGLGECADTAVGDDMLRGVSGGQRKRVTLAEMMVSNARMLCLDEVSTGLDAAVTTSIFSNLRSMCQLNGSSVVATLLQPTPETYALFDQIILLHDGQVMFHGARTELQRWLWEVCGLDVPASVDEASFLMDFLVNPAMAYESAQIIAQAQSYVQVTRAAREASEIVSQLEHKENMAAEGGVLASPGAYGAALPQTTPAQRPELYDQYETYSKLAPAAREQHQADHAGEPSHVNLHFGTEDEDEDSVEPAGDARDADDAEVSTGAVTLQSPDTPEMAPGKLKRFGLQPKHSTAAVAPVRDMADLQSRYKLSRWHQQMHAALSSGKSAALFPQTVLHPADWSAYTRANFAQQNPHSPSRHMALCWRRQWKLFSRAIAIMVPRMAKAFLIGLCYGLLFFQLKENQFVEKLAVVMYAGIFAAMTNLSELPVASQARNVIAKQLDAGFFRASPYTIAAYAMHIPVTLVESLCYGLLFYWLSGLASDGGRFLFHILLCVMASNCMAAMYRWISYVTPNPDIARQLDMPFVVLFIIMNGYLVTYSSIPIWLRSTAYWITPLSWTTRSLAINEYSASKYDMPAPADPTQRIGDYYLEQFHLQGDIVWKWMGVVYMFGWLLVWGMLCTYSLNRVGLIGPQGSEREHYAAVEELSAKQRKAKAKELAAARAGFCPREGGVELAAVSGSPALTVAVDIADEGECEVRDGIPDVIQAIDGAPAGKSAIVRRNSLKLQLGALPFTPVTLSWEHLNYSVTLPNGQERVLLRDISGFGVPGQMTALMGASGAGKTTLMDCCAGRKTTGHMSGRILLNGQPADIHSAFFQQLCGYVEQNDLHIGTATVEEALRFSARLRLPSAVPVETQHQFVREVMVLLGLDSFAGHLIGDAAIPGLGPAQLKLVTIGVELVANPSILFLDEPTSGLDAPAAWRVMTAIKRIALTGRTVLCTIHQPAARLFFLFDRLLLLQPGGRTIYFHRIGSRGEDLVSYLEAASGFSEKLPLGMNPADFALGLRSDGPLGDWADKWLHSKLNVNEVQPLIAKNANPASFNEAEKRAATTAADAADFVSWWQRYWIVQQRLILSYWRNSPMNLTRFVIAVVLGFLVGLTYYHVRPSDFGGVNSFLAGMMMALLFGPSLSCVAALPTMFRQRAIFYRESTVRMYDVRVYQLSLTVVEFFAQFVIMMCNVLPMYWLMGLNPAAVPFFRFFFIIFLMSQVYASFAQSYLAFLPNQVSAAVVHAIIFAFMFVFGGLLISAKAYPYGLKWFYHMLPTPKGMVALCLGQLSCSDDPALSGGFGCGSIVAPDGAMVQVYAFVSDILENSADSYGNQVGWLLLTIGVLKILTAIGFRCVSHLKR